MRPLSVHAQMAAMARRPLLEDGRDALVAVVARGKQCERLAIRRQRFAERRLEGAQQCFLGRLGRREVEGHDW